MAFTDPIRFMNQVDCGQHCDLICFAGKPDYVRWLYDLYQKLTPQQISVVRAAICCSKECGITPPAKMVEHKPGIEAWWWWK